jgi:hemolysin III
MAFVHLKQLYSSTADNPIHWNYDRTELIADGIVHAVGVGFGLVGAIVVARHIYNR